MPFTPPWDAANLAVSDAQQFGSHLYFGTANENGGEVWRTDGFGWQQVVAVGFGDDANYAVNALAVFGGHLYAATSNLTTGIEIWRSNTGDRDTWRQVNADGFGRGVTREDLTLAVFGQHLYAGVSRVVGATARAELWRSMDGTQWEAVFTNGLGDAGNSQLSALEEFQGQFYLGLRNETTGGQLWRSADGRYWERVFTDGLGVPGNSRLHGLLAKGDQFYLVVSNVVTGAQVWRSTDGTAWEPVMQGGWGDPAHGFADYFDKAAAIFRGVLAVGTVNETLGGQVWHMGSLGFLPLIVR